MKTKDDFYMEDVTTLALKAFAIIEEGLKEFDIKLNNEEDDAIFVPLLKSIEKHSNGDYRHYN